MKTKASISGSGLKMIALVTMLIDHFAAIVLDGVLRRQTVDGNIFSDAFSGWLEVHPFYERLYMLDLVMREIGRIAFPIFCFLLIEGFSHTRNVFKYAGNLFLFALISEIPFDLAFSDRVFFMGYQNVFFTLLLGLCTIWGMKYVSKYPPKWSAFLQVLIVLAGCFLAEILKTDYAGAGVLTIAVMYALRAHKIGQMAGGCIVLSVYNLSELTSFLSIWPVAYYNGKRGLNLKYLFYVFYPLHILILYLVLRWI